MAAGNEEVSLPASVRRLLPPFPPLRSRRRRLVEMALRLSEEIT
jgi:hypothetical protein